MDKVFLNLTNGLLYDGPFDGFIRIQSCHCEQKAWDKLIQNIDSNFLMLLALGHDISVVDYSAKKETPRALYQGLEFLWYCCCVEWGIPMKANVRGSDCTSYFNNVIKFELSKSSRRKIQYFKKFTHNPKKPKIITGKTDKDGDYEFFKELGHSLRAE